MKPKRKHAAILATFLLLAMWFAYYQDLCLLMVALDRQMVRPLAIPAWAQPTVSEHPFSRPVTEPLPWEDDPTFKELCARHGAHIRMGAFTTTLPDPLPGEEHNFKRAAELVAGFVLEPDQVFSMLQDIGPFDASKGFCEGAVYVGGRVVRGMGGGVCKMATTLYNVAILADLPIVARRNHSMLVPYANPGQDATVSSPSIDLKFKNDTGHPIVIWADTVDYTLYVAFYGQRVPPDVVWHHEVLQVQERPVIRRFNPQLAPGEERIMIPGAEGIAVKSWVELRYPDGRTAKRDLGIDWYRPMARIIEYGPPEK
jgi:vancomycin resistance protein VanW